MSFADMIEPEDSPFVNTLRDQTWNANTMDIEEIKKKCLAEAKRGGNEIWLNGKLRDDISERLRICGLHVEDQWKRLGTEPPGFAFTNCTCVRWNMVPEDKIEGIFRVRIREKFLNKFWNWLGY